MNSLLSLISTSRGIACHTADVRPNYIFVAIKGRITDGNSYAKIAADKGASAIITDHPDLLPVLTVPIYPVKDARSALAFLAHHYYQLPSQNMSVIGVTGTNGKTTITYMIAHILQESHKKCGIIGTLNIDFITKTITSSLTTPDPVSLQRSLAEMRNLGLSHAAIEISAQGIDMHRTDYIKLSCGILSNISPDHLDFHSDFSNYLQAKKKFLNLLGSDAPLIVNIADPYCDLIRQLHTASRGRTITTGFTPYADVSAEILTSEPYDSKFILTISKPLITINQNIVPAQEILLSLPLPGRHNVENAVLAATAALLHDVPLHTIKTGLMTFPSVARRMNIFSIGGFTIIDDTALNPGSINAIFDTIQNIPHHNMVVVNAIRGNRGIAMNELNAQTLAEWQRKLMFELIITSSCDCVDIANIVNDQELLTFRQTLHNNHCPTHYHTNLRDALSHALAITQPADLLVLIGAQGMDEGMNIIRYLHLEKSRLLTAN